MKVRGRVLENRLDLELEKNGDILVNGRNEREIILFDLEDKRERPNESSWIRKYNIRGEKISEI